MSECVVADMRLVCASYRSEAEQVIRNHVGTIALEWRFFENDPFQCEQNICGAAGARSPEPRLAKMKEFSEKYSVPSDALRMPVWREQR